MGLETVAGTTGSRVKYLKWTRIDHLRCRFGLLLGVPDGVTLQLPRCCLTHSTEQAPESDDSHRRLPSGDCRNRMIASMGPNSPTDSRAAAWSSRHAVGKAIALHMVLFMISCCLVPSVQAHGYLSKPVSRNYYENLQSRFWNRK